MEQSKIGCLVIHGFGGSVYEIESLADHLAKKGYKVAYPHLSGHTGRRQDMKKATYKDWIASAEQQLLRLKDKADEIVIIGFSMGGLIGVNLACEYEIKAITTINSPIYCWNAKIVLQNLVGDIMAWDFTNFKRYIRAAKNSPIASLYNFEMLLKQSRPKIRLINCPILIMQAKDDDTVRNSSADYIYKNVSSEHKEIRFYDIGGHLLLRSPSAQQAIGDVEAFLDSLQ